MEIRLSFMSLLLLTFLGNRSLQTKINQIRFKGSSDSNCQETRMAKSWSLPGEQGVYRKKLLKTACGLIASG